MLDIAIKSPKSEESLRSNSEYFLGAPNFEAEAFLRDILRW